MLVEVAGVEPAVSCPPDRRLTFKTSPRCMCMTLGGIEPATAAVRVLHPSHWTTGPKRAATCEQRSRPCCALGGCRSRVAGLKGQQSTVDLPEQEVSEGLAPPTTRVAAVRLSTSASRPWERRERESNPRACAASRFPTGLTCQRSTPPLAGACIPLGARLFPNSSGRAHIVDLGSTQPAVTVRLELTRPGDLAAFKAVLATCTWRHHGGKGRT